MSMRSNNKRVKFKEGAQKAFILKVERKIKSNISQLSGKLNINKRTLADWKREKYKISESALKSISNYSKIGIPRNIEIIGPYWYASKAGRAGYSAVIKKYGKMLLNEPKRISNWKLWWKQEGKSSKNKILLPLNFNKPEKSDKLAEFFGIMIGDGSMNKYQLFVTLHYRDDFKFGIYVTKLMKKLFGVNPRVRRSQNVHTYSISRVELVKYLNNLGLKIGNKIKQNLDIPSWILKDENFSKACLRGIFDTDGCLVRHTYKSHGKVYTYKKIDITSKSEKLLSTIQIILNQLKIKNRMGRNCIRIEAKEDVNKFFSKIGSKNPKHTNKYKNMI
jgi:hypothetical protein